jgi:hypothetical protein
MVQGTASAVTSLLSTAVDAVLGRRTGEQKTPQGLAVGFLVLGVAVAAAAAVSYKLNPGLSSGAGEASPYSDEVVTECWKG